MIFLAVGLPGRFAEWCETLLLALARAASLRPAIFNANALEEIGSALLRHNSGDAVVVARQPRTNLVEILQSERLPFLLVLEEPGACVAALMKDHGADFLGAIRTVSNSCALAFPLVAFPHALVLQAGNKQGVNELAQTIASHFQLNIGREALAAAAAHPDVTAFGQRFAEGLPVPAYLPGNATAADLDAPLPDTPILQGALDPLWRSLKNRQLREIIWRRELFYSPDRPAQPLSATIDVTGSSRCLMFGPYIHLPEGGWSCNLMLGCSPEATGLRMVAEIYAGAPVSRVTFTLEEAGFIEIEFSFVLGDSDHPIEVRLFNTEAAFEGHIAIVQVRMAPLAAKRLQVRTP